MHNFHANPPGWEADAPALSLPGVGGGGTPETVPTCLGAGAHMHLVLPDESVRSPQLSKHHALLDHFRLLHLVDLCLRLSIWKLLSLQWLSDSVSQCPSTLHTPTHPSMPFPFLSACLPALCPFP